MNAVLDKAIAGFVTLVRKDGYLDQAIWKLLATVRGKQSKKEA